MSLFYISPLLPLFVTPVIPSFFLILSISNPHSLTHILFVSLSLNPLSYPLYLRFHPCLCDNDQKTILFDKFVLLLSCCLLYVLLSHVPHIAIKRWKNLPFCIALISVYTIIIPIVYSGSIISIVFIVVQLY